MNLQLLETELKRDEGIRYQPYKDTEGYWTVGVGYNLDAHPLPDGVSLPLSNTEVDILLEISIKDVLKGLKTHLPWYERLDEVRQRVLANMAFNLGIYGLLKFKKTLAAVERGDYKVAATEMLSSPWAMQVKGRAIRLAGAMTTGEMP